MAIRCGRFTYRNIDFVAFAIWMSAITFGVQQIFPIFMNLKPKWSCENGDLSQNCTFLVACEQDNLTYSSAFKSVVEEFSLLCGHEAWYPSLITTIQFVGVLLGTIICGQISDIFGRKKVSLAILICAMLSSALTGAAPNWQALAVIRFVVGFCAGGCMNVVFAYIMEVILTEHRIFVRGFFNWGWARVIGTLICFIVPHWRYASMALSAVCLPAILLIAFLFPESPKWSESKGRLQEMKRSLDWIAKFNKEPLLSYNDNQNSNQIPRSCDFQEAHEIETVQKQKVYTIIDLFATPHMRIQTLTLMMMWFAASLSSYANDLNSRNLAGNFWVNQFLFGVLIGLSKPLLFILDTFMPQFNRRYLHQVPQFLVVVCYVLILILLSTNSSPMGVVVINLIGTFLIEYTWDACYVCAAEGFPTVARTLGIGLSSFTARIGAIIAPQMAYLANFWLPAPFATVAVIGLISLVISWKFLPDTKGQELLGSIAAKENMEFFPEENDLNLEQMKPLNEQKAA